MSTFKKVPTCFLNVKALGFLRNYIANHSESIPDEDTVKILNTFMSDKKLLDIIYNAFPKSEHTSPQFEAINTAFTENESIPETFVQLWGHKKHRARTQALLLKFIDKELKKKYKLDKDPISTKWAELISELDLNQVEQDVLLITYLINCKLLAPDGEEEDLPRRSRRHRVVYSIKNLITYFAKCVNCSTLDIQTAVAESGKLQRYNLIDDDLDFNGSLETFLDGLTTEPLCSRFYTKSNNDVLPWDFYEEETHKHGEIIMNIIRQNRNHRGVNILFYGEPGTGKTSFANTLTHKLNMQGYEINHAKQHDNPVRFRYAALDILSNRMNPETSIAIVDEADAMLSGNSGGTLLDLFQEPTHDKANLNNVLDRSFVTTIWICNTQSRMLDKSNRRRFDYSIKFNALTDAQRLNIWKNQVEQFNLKKAVKGS